MTAIERIRQKFWAQMPARIAMLDELLGRARDGDPESTESIASLVHTAKGEAQLLSLEPCASLLELADRLGKATRGAGVYPAATLDTFDAVRAALSELVDSPAGGSATRAATSAVESALDRAGDRRT